MFLEDFVGSHDVLTESQNDSGSGKGFHPEAIVCNFRINIRGLQANHLIKHHFSSEPATK